MDNHVRVLGIINIVFGVFGVLLLLGLAMIFAIAMANADIGHLSDGDELAVMIASVIGMVFGALFLVVSIVGILAGINLMNYRPWARTAVIIISCINLLNIPFGTALGVYGLWVLVSDETRQLFEAGGPSGTAV